jgi:hypothetical protein
MVCTQEDQRCSTQPEAVLDLTSTVSLVHIEPLHIEVPIFGQESEIFSRGTYSKGLRNCGNRRLVDDSSSISGANSSAIDDQRELGQPFIGRGIGKDSLLDFAFE